MEIDIMDLFETEKINLTDFSNKVNNLGREENKKEFLKNYNDYKVVIESIDDYIEKKSSEINYDNLELLELIKLLDSKIKEDDDVKKKNLLELVNIKKILESIEKKINSTNTFSIQKIN